MLSYYSSTTHLVFRMKGECIDLTTPLYGNHLSEKDDDCESDIDTVLGTPGSSMT